MTFFFWFFFVCIACFSSLIRPHCVVDVKKMDFACCSVKIGVGTTQKFSKFRFEIASDFYIFA